MTTDFARSGVSNHRYQCSTLIKPINPEVSSFIDTTTPKQRAAATCRRLETQIVSYSTNYYVTYPRHIGTITTPTPSLSSTLSSKQQSNNCNEYCDLFNLLGPDVELKLIAQQQSQNRRKRQHCRRRQSQFRNICSSGRFQPSATTKLVYGYRRRSVDFENAHARVRSEKRLNSDHHNHNYIRKKAPAAAAIAATVP